MRVALPLDMSNDATVVLGKSSKAIGRTLVQFEEWHNTADSLDAGSVYTLLASLESTIRASSIDLGIE